MKINRTHLLSLSFVVLSFVIAAAFYGRLPQLVPTHWNASGLANGFTPKPLGPFLMPLVMAGVYLLLRVLPRISPRGYRIESFQGIFEVFQVSILGFLFLMNVMVLLTASGAPVPMSRVASAGIGLLFVVLGNFMGKVTRNFFVGIRTPWTLANEEVWLRTHRLGGKLFVLAGIGLFIAGLLGAEAPAIPIAVGIAAGIPIVYSYVVYRKLEGLPKSAGSDPGGSPPGPG